MRIRQQETVYEEIFEGTIQDSSLKLVYFGQVRHKPMHSIIAHVHGYFEVSILIEGSVDYTLDNYIHQMNIGDICLAKPGELHSMTGVDDNEWEVYYAAFEGLGIPELDAILRNTKVAVIKASSDMIKDFEKIISNTKALGYGRLHMSHLLLNAFLIDLVNGLGNSALTEESHCNSSIVDEGRDYIERNVRHRLSVDEISNAVGLSKSRLANCFSKEMGTPIYNYMRQILMQRALRLLENRKMNISEIADALDFPTIYCFSSTFKRYWGYSPSEYRRRLVEKV